MPPDDVLQLREQNAALQQQCMQLQVVLNQRSLAAVATLVDGLNAALAAAQAGDPGSRQLLAQLRQALASVEQVDSRIVIANGHLPG
jgi:hypothetical protein